MDFESCLGAKVGTVILQHVQKELVKNLLGIRTQKKNHNFIWSKMTHLVLQCVSARFQGFPCARWVSQHCSPLPAQWERVHVESRLSGHRCHHQLHQHQQPICHARSRSVYDSSIPSQDFVTIKELMKMNAALSGLLAKKAIQSGLSVRPYIKTSLSPGSGVVTYYLKESGVMDYLSQLG